MRTSAWLLPLFVSLIPAALAAPAKKLLSSEIKAKAEFAGDQSVSEIKTSMSTPPEEEGLEQKLGGYTGNLKGEPISGHFAVIIERPKPREVLYKFRVYRQAAGEPSAKLMASPQILTNVGVPAKVTEDNGETKFCFEVSPREIKAR
jgi:hypothetical protein